MPIKGSFAYKAKEEEVNVYKNAIDDIFDDGRRESEYYSFKPEKFDDIKNFVAMLNVENATTRGMSYKEFYNPYVQPNELTVGKVYLVSYYPDSQFYTIVEAEQFGEAIKMLINQTLGEPLIA